MLGDCWTGALRKVHPGKECRHLWNVAFRGSYDKSSGLRMDYLLLPKVTSCTIRPITTGRSLLGYSQHRYRHGGDVPRSELGRS